MVSRKIDARNPITNYFLIELMMIPDIASIFFTLPSTDPRIYCPFCSSKSRLIFIILMVNRRCKDLRVIDFKIMRARNLPVNLEPYPGRGQRVVKVYYLREPGSVTEPGRSKKLSKTTFSFTRKIKGSTLSDM